MAWRDFQGVAPERGASASLAFVANATNAVGWVSDAVLASGGEAGSAQLALPSGFSWQVFSSTRRSLSRAKWRTKRYAIGSNSSS